MLRGPNLIYKVLLGGEEVYFRLRTKTHQPKEISLGGGVVKLHLEKMEKGRIRTGGAKGEGKTCWKDNKRIRGKVRRLPLQCQKGGEPKGGEWQQNYGECSFRKASC